MKRNITISLKTFLELEPNQRSRLHLIVDSMAVYEAISLVDALYPGQWQEICTKFSFIIRDSLVSFEGMGLTKDVSIIHKTREAVDFGIYGRCLNLLNRFASGVDGVTFLVPNSQKIANSVYVSDFNGAIPGKDFTNFRTVERSNLFGVQHHLVQGAKIIFESILATDPQGHDVDGKDLVYQCLFRLMSLSPEQYCQGDLRIEHLYGFPYHECDSLNASNALFKRIYDEQKQVLVNEYYNPEQMLFRKLNSLVEERGKLQMIDGYPYLVLDETKIKLELREVDASLADRIHKSFHYIHTPRNTGYSLGLFKVGDEYPISVIGVEKVDRDYKKHALLRYNISPNHTYELTRMYSCRNSPANTSSFMLAVANSYLKTIDPDWQASISSFMPSYATGLSMLSGGFKDILYVKECVHNYQGDAENRLVVRTNRSKRNEHHFTNKTKLMPVVELIHTRGKFLEAIRADNDMHMIVSNNETAKDTGSDD